MSSQPRVPNCREFCGGVFRANTGAWTAPRRSGPSLLYGVCEGLGEEVNGVRPWRRLPGAGGAGPRGQVLARGCWRWRVTRKCGKSGRPSGHPSPLASIPGHPGASLLSRSASRGSFVAKEVIHRALTSKPSSEQSSGAAASPILNSLRDIPSSSPGGVPWPADDCLLG